MLQPFEHAFVIPEQNCVERELAAVYYQDADGAPSKSTLKIKSALLLVYLQNKLFESYF